MAVLFVFVGGCVGAVARYMTDRFIQSRHDMQFPWGTYTVNIVGSLLLGIVAGATTASSHWLALLLGTGFCGALTTFSTFSFESFRLLEEGSLLEAGLNVVGSLIVGVGCLAGGFALGAALL